MDRIRVARWARGAAALLNPANHLSQGFDFPFVTGFLPIGFLEQFEKQLHLVQGVAQIVDDVLDIFDRLPQRRGFHRPERRSMGMCRRWHWPGWARDWSRSRLLVLLSGGVLLLFVQILARFRGFRGLGVRREDGFVVAAKRFRLRSLSDRCTMRRAAGYGFVRWGNGGGRFLGSFGFIRCGISRGGCWRCCWLVAGSTADGATDRATYARPAWLG
jgi:hypothetical protein